MQILTHILDGIHAEGGGSVRAFVADLPSVPVPDGVLLNLNTPEDLSRIR